MSGHWQREDRDTYTLLTLDVKDSSANVLGYEVLDELDQILNIASEDSHIDRHEQALLDELQDMIESKVVKVIF